MTLGPTYSTGSISVAANGTAVTGAGTAWQTYGILEGDTFWADGDSAWVKSVDGEGAITLYDPWTGGTLSGASYRIRLDSWQRYDAALTQKEVRDLISALGAQVFIFIVTGAAPDPSLGEEGQIAIRVNTAPFKLWTRTGGAWVELGIPLGVAWERAYDTTKVYEGDDIVSRNGKTYIAQLVNGAHSTVTVTIASPGVVTWTAHNLPPNAPVVLTTTGALPTGCVAGTTYYVVGASITANTFQLSATPSGSAINTSGTQSGAHTASNIAPPESFPAYWDIFVDNGDRYDIAFFDSDQPASAEEVIKWVAPSATVFRAALSDSQGKSSVAATSTATYTLKKNGTTFATMVFAASATVATFVCVADTTFNAGDVLTVLAPSPQDVTLSNITSTIVGYR